MDVSEMLSKESTSLGETQPAEAPRQSHSYPTRHANAGYTQLSYVPNMNQPGGSGGYGTVDRGQTLLSPTKGPESSPKTVNFQLLLSHGGNSRARLPLRVHINPHDTTDSIVTTVKNFYGLYDGQGVSFEDNHGVTLIAQYENLSHNATIYVRIFAEQPEVTDMHNRSVYGADSPRRPRLEEPFQMPLAPPLLPRANSQTLKRRSPSPPGGRGRNSPTARSQHRLKQRSTHDMADDDAANGVSDSDAGSVSVSSSRRDLLASAEISLDNIVEGGRRKKAKFESSELPLFVPSQQPMAASLSSISPQRRMTNSFAPSPLPPNNQYTFSYNQPLPSPQSFSNHEFTTPNSFPSGNRGQQNQSHGHRLRTRDMGNHKHARLSGGSVSGVFPTPDPTNGSVISDEDVALQLMRLGDASNLSSYGRTSTSTADDALSGKAEGASSVEPSDDDSEEDEGHGPRKRMRPHNAAESSADEYDDFVDNAFRGGSDEIRPAMGHGKPKGLKIAKNRLGHVKGQLHARPPSNGAKIKSKSANGSSKIPPSPYGAPPGSVSRKSSASTPGLMQDEEDLSAKPRCQRCRKSKKGCDRQRPCQRCKDAGIGIEGCVSEDEGNGRKGRYGRHMGVAIKKSDMDPPMDYNMPVADSVSMDSTAMADVSKKRKR